MKFLIYGVLGGVFWTVVPGMTVFAQKAGVKLSEIPISEDTSIEISKGRRDTKIRYGVFRDEQDLEGESASSKAAAVQNWTRACADWKKEMKELQKDSQLLSISCGTRKLREEGSHYAYSSTGRYTIRVAVEAPETTGKR